MNVRVCECDCAIFVFRILSVRFAWLVSGETECTPQLLSERHAAASVIRHEIRSQAPQEHKLGGPMTRQSTRQTHDPYTQRKYIYVYENIIFPFLCMHSSQKFMQIEKKQKGAIVRTYLGVCVYVCVYLLEFA